MPLTKGDLSQIRNKVKRTEQYNKLKKQGNKERLKRRLEKRQAQRRGEEVEKGHTRTVENTAEWLGDEEHDDRMKPANVNIDEETGDVNVNLGSLNDLFPEESQDAAFSDRKVFITTSPGKPASPLTKELLEQLTSLLGGKKRVDVIVRRTPQYTLRKVAKWVRNRGYGCLIVIHEDHKRPNYMSISHLPVGPTAHFRLTGIVPSHAIEGHGRPTAHAPELVLNKFQTPLGLSVATMLSRLFLPPRVQQQLAREQFIGRQVVLAQNSRDYIFIRRYRYMFDQRVASAMKPIAQSDWEHDDFLKTHLQEIGPRFTLKLRWIRRGIIAERPEDKATQWTPDEEAQQDIAFGDENGHEGNDISTDMAVDKDAHSGTNGNAPQDQERTEKTETDNGAPEDNSKGAVDETTAPPKLSRKEKRERYREYLRNRSPSPSPEPEVAPVDEKPVLGTVGTEWHIGRGAGGNRDLADDREWRWDPKMGVSRRKFFL